MGHRFYHNKKRVRRDGSLAEYKPHRYRPQATPNGPRRRRSEIYTVVGFMVSLVAVFSLYMLMVA